MLSVKRIAGTQVTEGYFEFLDICDLSYLATDPEALAEFAGRSCYQSWNRPNPATARTDQYIIRNILDKGHESVLEHPTVTYYVTGVSRTLTHELIRHRHLNFSELSQRYVDIGEVQFVEPPLIRDSAGIAPVDMELDSVRDTYDALADMLEFHNPTVTRKRIREAARSVMPNAAETRIVVTGNARAWRHVIGMRGSEHADAEIREFAVEVFRDLREWAPAIFADMDIVVLEDGRETVQHV